MMRIGTADPEDRQRGLGAAAAALRRGQLVGLPLDTSYGIAADAFSERGTQALRTAKGRPDLSIPVMVPKMATVAGLAQVDAIAGRLMLDFWPGPLTLVLRAQATLAWSLTDPAGRIAVRMPLHPVALELLARTGPLGVVAGSSAPAMSALGSEPERAPARLGSEPERAPVRLGAEPERATARSGAEPGTVPAPAPDAAIARTPVLDVDSAFPPDLAGQLAVLLDAGLLPISAPSAVVDLTGAHPMLVRPGPLAIDTLRESCPELVVPGAVGREPAP